MTALNVSRVTVPPDWMASLALITRFRMTNSSWIGSTRAGQRYGANVVLKCTVAPKVELSRSLIATILLLRSTA
jgi:hypothetical protein